VEQTQHICISCYKPIASLETALELSDGNGLVYLVCSACQLEAMPKEPLQKGGGVVRVIKGYAATYNNKPQWERVAVDGYDMWQDTRGLR